MVECAGFLPRYGLAVIVGSNPTASADFAGIEGVLLSQHPVFLTPNPWREKGGVAVMALLKP